MKPHDIQGHVNPRYANSGQLSEPAAYVMLHLAGTDPMSGHANNDNQLGKPATHVRADTSDWLFNAFKMKAGTRQKVMKFGGGRKDQNICNGLGLLSGDRSFYLHSRSATLMAPTQVITLSGTVARAIAK